MIPDTLEKQIHPLKMVLLDVDGVLTTGTIIYNDNGSETKVFNVRDGLGIRLLMDAGITVGIVTGRASGALKARCKNLGIELIFDGIKDKVFAIEAISRQTGLSCSEMAFVGDDLPDVRAMKRSGFPVAVANACAEVKNAASYTTSANGGEGAVREICELILKTQGLWDRLMEKYL